MSNGTLSFAEALGVLGQQEAQNKALWLIEKQNKEKNSRNQVSPDYASYKFTGDEKPGTFHYNVKERSENSFGDKERLWKLIEAHACKSMTAIYVDGLKIDGLYKTAESVVPNPDGAYMYGWAKFIDKNGTIIETKPMFIGATPHPGHWIALLVFMGYLNDGNPKCQLGLYNALLATAYER